MIKLYGFPISNYYNMVKMTLLEKGMAFEEVLVRPSQESDYLSCSPMGKVPCLETGQGFLTETEVIIDYLHDLGQGPAFYPEDPFEKAKIRELIRYLELYIELPARRLYGDVFFGKPASDTEKESVRKELQKGFAALRRLADYSPYIGGNLMTYADFYFLFSVGLVTRVTKKALDWDVFSTEPGIRELLALMEQRDSVKAIRAAQKATM
ncbi:glutathione S-transferase family protein [Pseudohongiella sp.]|uniref:GST N-terminal domain-containing protein n=1 Tax=marine sediment metagenome TaxID=412755 RepID=A0A0F9W8W0_9ZZZZ|nr:glutathione S-transferase [Pseudohongiella sp.]HDZ08101.1 glutathione S-transferase [Pseudohongiella sp.]HEA63069.1 glutathione S-transferase [Pseudohongiella sp.]